MILWDIGKHSPDAASHPRKLESSNYKMPNIPSACGNLISPQAVIIIHLLVLRNLLSIYMRPRSPINTFRTNAKPHKDSSPLCYGTTQTLQLQIHLICMFFEPNILYWARSKIDKFREF